MVRLSVDIGGTFTDIVLAGDGLLRTHKVLSTRAPEMGALQGIDDILESSGLALDQVSTLVHGTTLATNALIERRGAKTALVTTLGFRDVLEMRNEKRFDQYALDIQLPDPLIPRDLRFTLDERILADGTVLRRPRCKEIQSIAASLQACEVEAVAIGFLHSYRYPEHEQLVAHELGGMLGNAVTICQSAEVANEIREFDRFSTVSANAYVRPLMSSYLKKFEQELQARGFTGAFLLMLSGGGLTTVEQATRTPVRLVESGPAGGAMLAADVSTELESAHTLALDIGGTTAKICFIENSVPQTTRRFEIARSWKNAKGSGLPVRVPTIELVEIGAGGGSVAKIDAVGRISLGPESAGADPGPCAYGRGGTAATLTDAHVVVSNIVESGFAGGAIALSQAAANDAIATQLADKLGVGSLEIAAAGVIEIADELMANAARVHGIELGKNISQFDLLVSGGGGALHGTRIAEKLGIKRVIVPCNAGVGSAVGFLCAPVSFALAVTVMQSIDDIDYLSIQEKTNAAIRTVSDIVSSVDSAGQPVLQVEAELRYTGQDFELRFPLDVSRPFEQALAGLRDDFVARFRALHGFVLEDIAVELVSIAVSARASTRQLPGSATKPGDHEVSPAATEQPIVRAVYDLDQGAYVDFRACSRESLQAGMVLEGPAIVTEAQTTTIVRNGWSAHVRGSGHLVLERGAGL